ncbi:MAG: hypothetical protein C5B58_10885 [Acidobacteria bacterium]|nr:MAG: hypothetical protein C5B58_10885 [Acidobacteriota bacterium]
MLRLGEATFSNEMRIRVRGMPEESADWLQTVTAAARQAMAKLDRRFPLDGALEIEIEFLLKRTMGIPGRALAAAVPDLRSKPADGHYRRRAKGCGGVGWCGGYSAVFERQRQDPGFMAGRRRDLYSPARAAGCVETATFTRGA